MSNLILKSFEDNEIRIVLIDNIPWFVAKDVCDALGYSNSRDAISKLVWADNKQIASVAISDTLGGNQLMSVINEQGIYQLIFGSKKPNAKLFQKWVFEEVLPSINKTGSYSIKNNDANLTDNLISSTEILMQSLLVMKTLEQKVKVIEDKIDPYIPDTSKATMEAYCKINGIKMGDGVGIMVYHKCNTVARNNTHRPELQLDSISHPFKGSITLYPKLLLDLVIAKAIEDNIFFWQPKRKLNWLLKV